jgi:hypothetical protein
LRRLVKGREPFVLLVGAGLAATAAWLARFVAVDWAYYARETSNSRLAEITLGDRSASTVLYVLQGFRAELGPVLFVASALATWALFRRRHEHRWFLTLWWLGPLAVLSVLTKKNSYYAYYAWTAMPAAIGVGLSQIRSRPARIAACAAAGVGAWVLCVSWFTGAAGFQPWPESLLRHFQETPTVRPGPPRVVSEYPAEEARTLADATALARPDPCPRVVVAFPDRLTRHSANELMYYLGENDPRIVWYEWSYAHWPPVADEAPLFVDWRNGEEMGDATERLRSLWREDARSASPGFLPVRGPADRLDRLELRLVAETPAWVLYALADAPPVVSCPDNPIGSKREEGRP